jgi:UDP-3-O-[3-hydroxymyristoyl] glucosamine N-acyltransferase
MRTTVGALAAAIGGKVRGDVEAAVIGVASAEEARAGDVVLAANRRFLEKALASEAECIIVGEELADAAPGRNVICCAKPEEAFAKVLSLFSDHNSAIRAGIAAGAVVESGASLGRGVAIGPNSYVGAGACVGDNCIIYPNVYVGENVRIGDECVLHPGVAIYRDCSLGRGVIVHAGAVIGSDGFGYVPGDKGLVKFPHLGRVEIGDDVEIGANATIDRAKTGATIVGDGTKIDNLVHIAHNVKIGKNCIIVALSGIAGSVEIGNGVTLAAQTGVKDHVVIEDGCIVAARAGVIGNIKRGSVVSGFPARDHRAEKRAQAAWLRLPEMMERIRALEGELQELRAGVKHDHNSDARD